MTSIFIQTWIYKKPYIEKGDIRKEEMYGTPEMYRVGVVSWYSILMVQYMGGAVCTEDENMEMDCC